MAANRAGGRLPHPAATNRETSRVYIPHHENFLATTKRCARSDFLYTAAAAAHRAPSVPSTLALPVTLRRSVEVVFIVSNNSCAFDVRKSSSLYINTTNINVILRYILLSINWFKTNCCFFFFTIFAKKKKIFYKTF